jgi:nitrogenase-associated protein
MKAPMAHITFYEKPGCGGNARQKTMLLAANHTLDVKNLLETPWKEAELLLFLSPLAVPDWFNRAAPQVKSGEVVPESLSADAALALLLAQPLLIRRPLMVVGERRMVGFDTAAVHAWVGLGEQPVPPRSLEGCAAAAGDCTSPL